MAQFVGIRPDIPETLWGMDRSLAYWGARAIYNDSGRDKYPTFDLVNDRQQFEGPSPACTKLSRWVTKIGLKAMRKHFKTNRRYPRRDEDREVRIERDGFVIVANPKASHGYLYLGAWKLE